MADTENRPDPFETAMLVGLGWDPGYKVEDESIVAACARGARRLVEEAERSAEAAGHVRGYQDGLSAMRERCMAIVEAEDWIPNREELLAKLASLSPSDPPTDRDGPLVELAKEGWTVRPPSESEN